MTPAWSSIGGQFLPYSTFSRTGVIDNFCQMISQFNNMDIRCFHCGSTVPITAEQLGSEVSCPACGDIVRLPEAVGQPDSKTVDIAARRTWLDNSIAGLFSLVIHFSLLLVFASVTCDHQGGGVIDGDEVLIGILPQLDLTEQDDGALDASTAMAPATDPQDRLIDEFEVLTPLDASTSDALTDLDFSDFRPSGGGGGGIPDLAALAGGGGALGQGASFMGLHAKGTRFCIIADCSGSMEGPPLKFLKEEVLETINSMPTQARFQLIFFSSRAIPYPQPGWRHPRRDQIELANWLQGVQAGGGTYPTPAFELAFRLNPPPDVIFFMTDGLFAERVVDEIAKLNRQGGRGAQIHTISFMDTSSESLMRRIANDSGGRYRHVAGF